MAASLAVVGLAVDSGQIAWIWLAYPFMLGCAAGPAYAVISKATMANGQVVSQAGLATGYFGLWAGLWAALSSFVSNPIVGELGGGSKGWAEYFYICSGAMFVISLPACILLTLPAEWQHAAPPKPAPPKPAPRAVETEKTDHVTVAVETKAEPAPAAAPPSASQPPRSLTTAIMVRACARSPPDIMPR